MAVPNATNPSFEQVLFPGKLRVVGGPGRSDATIKALIGTGSASSIYLSNYWQTAAVFVLTNNTWTAITIP